MTTNKRDMQCMQAAGMCTPILGFPNAAAMLRKAKLGWETSKRNDV